MKLEFGNVLKARSRIKSKKSTIDPDPLYTLPDDDLKIMKPLYKRLLDCVPKRIFQKIQSYKELLNLSFMKIIEILYIWILITAASHVI